MPFLAVVGAIISFKTSHNKRHRYRLSVTATMVAYYTSVFCAAIVVTTMSTIYSRNLSSSSNKVRHEPQGMSEACSHQQVVLSYPPPFARTRLERRPPSSDSSSSISWCVVMGPGERRVVPRVSCTLWWRVMTHLCDARSVWCVRCTTS